MARQSIEAGFTTPMIQQSSSRRRRNKALWKLSRRNHVDAIDTSTIDARHWLYHLPSTLLCLPSQSRQSSPLCTRPRSNLNIPLHVHDNRLASMSTTKRHSRPSLLAGKRRRDARSRPSYHHDSFRVRECHHSARDGVSAARFCHFVPCFEASSTYWRGHERAQYQASRVSSWGADRCAGGLADINRTGQGERGTDC